MNPVFSIYTKYFIVPFHSIHCSVIQCKRKSSIILHLDFECDLSLLYIAKSFQILWKPHYIQRKWSWNWENTVFQPCIQICHETTLYIYFKLFVFSGKWRIPHSCRKRIYQNFHKIFWKQSYSARYVQLEWFLLGQPTVFKHLIDRTILQILRTSGRIQNWC